jgi:hypothetical protein
VPKYLRDFGTFDGLDNRKELMYLLGKLGEGLPELEQARCRGRFLRRLLRLSENGFKDKDMEVSDACLVDSYLAFVAIVNALGVPIYQAMSLLEEEIRSGHKR